MTLTAITGGEAYGRANMMLSCTQMRQYNQHLQQYTSFTLTLAQRSMQVYSHRQNVCRMQKGSVDVLPSGFGKAFGGCFAAKGLRL